MRALTSLPLLLALAACGDKGGDDSGAGDGGGDGGGTVGGISIPEGQNMATMTVAEGSAVLAAGDYELESIGFAPQRNQDEFYANFAQSSETGVLRTLNFYGMNRVGSFACGDQAKPDDDYALETAMDLKDYASGVFFDSQGAGSSCTLTVTHLDETTIEGRYTATLVGTTDASVQINVEGEFRSHRAE